MIAHAQFHLPTASSTMTSLIASEPKPVEPQRFKLWCDLFLSHNISEQEKKTYALKFLQPYIDSIQHTQLGDLSHLDFEHTDRLEQQFLDQHQRICADFQSYLHRRKQNLPREFFPCVAHAFEFLYKVAPTKWVDGAWLYSCLEKSHLASHCDLTLIYLEELGLGDAFANHVSMYQQLLHKYDLSIFVNDLDDRYYEQAAIQCALAYIPQDFLPVIIGFNLGYEQLPLHLLITNYELQELGIDPQYFNVHITIDNAHNGHARRALDAFKINYAQAKHPSSFIELVKIGFLLNDIGKSSNTIIKELNPQQQVIQILQNKAVFGQLIHNEKCKFSGRSINEWLSQPDQINQFLEVLIDKGWIQLNAPAENSRFWHMIHHSDGKMFGVFNATEQQFIQDWIEGESLSQRLKVDQSRHSIHPTTLKNSSDLSEHQKELKQRLNAKTQISDKLEVLRPYLAPHLHHHDLGLWATQQYSKLLFPFQTHQTFN